MMLLHFLQRILKTLPWTLSSEIEYLAWQASQTIFMGGSCTGSGAGTPEAATSWKNRNTTRPRAGRPLGERIVQPNGLGAVRTDGYQAERNAGHALDRLDVGG